MEYGPDCERTRRPGKFREKATARAKPARKPAAKAKPAAGAKTKKYTPEQQEWIDDFREALHEVELHQQGKIQLQDARDFLNEL
ncbi:MAG: hypothetical protein EOO57_06290 [Hymenobacter sp.]|nr:MAG: hypothetical protein EOO57_06290 [Hymenobacter sp.]